jgi:hypothetical protein
LPNCPEAADVVDDYLLTGEIRGNLEDSVAETFTIRADWVETRFTFIVSLVQSLGPNHHVVVRGRRNERFQRTHQTTEFHFFVLANIGGQIYAIDAMTREIRSDAISYITENGFTTTYYTLDFQSEEAPVF